MASIREEIRDHLRKKGSITRLEALGLYGCMDVTTVIRDLKEGNGVRRPMKIKTDIRTDKNGKRYARYFVDRIARSPTVRGLRVV